MSNSYWRDIARASVQKALDEAKDQGLGPEATQALVNDRYPFGQREYYPYKVWLEERKKLLNPQPVKTRKPDQDKLAAWLEGRPIKD